MNGYSKEEIVEQGSSLGLGRLEKEALGLLKEDFGDRAVANRDEQIYKAMPSLL